jgi:hypothetical protein
MQSGTAGTAAAPFEVRWHATGRSRSKSFITRRLADSYRAELVRAARKGLEFDPVTGEPVLRAAPQPAATTWYRDALAYTDMKWPELAAHSRASMAEALATVSPCPDDGHQSAPASASAAGRAIRARIQPATPDQETGSGDGNCAGVAGACLAASGPAAESAGDPAGTRCPRRAAGSSPCRGEHHHPQARCLPQRARLRGRTRTARGQPARPVPAADAKSRQHGRPPGLSRAPGRSTPS